MRQLIMGERFIPGIRHQTPQLGNRVHGWQFLWASAVEGLIRALIGAAVAHVNDRAFQSRPRLKHAVTGNVVERPLHRNALDVKFLPVIAVLKDLGRIHVAVAGLNGIPTQPCPSLMRLFLSNFIRPRAGVMRHLNLAAKVCAVDDVAGMIFAGNESDSASQRQIHSNTNHSVIQIGHLGCRQLPGTQTKDGQDKAEPKTHRCPERKIARGISWFHFQQKRIGKNRSVKKPPKGPSSILYNRSLHRFTKRMKSLWILTAYFALPLLLTVSANATTNNPNTDWFKGAQYGVFMHFLPGSDAQLAQVKDFDVPTVAQQLEDMGAKYFIITLGQNSGYFISPNATYDRYTGYAAGERCSSRDLPSELYRTLQPKGIKLMLYLPCQVPNSDARAQKSFGLPQGRKDQPINAEFGKKWSEVIQEWADRYGDKVAGWWFDGGYAWVKFNEEIASIYAAAVKHGNPKAIVTFNPGVRVIHWTEAEDYTAGELNNPFEVIPSSRWLKGSQWHSLTFIGSQWGQRKTRYSNEQWVNWVKAVTSKGGVVTLDMGPNWNQAAGPIGSFAEVQVKQVKEIKTALRR